MDNNQRRVTLGRKTSLNVFKSEAILGKMYRYILAFTFKTLLGIYMATKPISVCYRYIAIRAAAFLQDKIC